MSNSLGEVIQSVGIDIGTTTTQLVLSELRVKNIAPGTLVPKMCITDKRIIYKSPLRFTPFSGNGLIDMHEIMRFVEREIKCAGVMPEAIGSGAVIITGETAKKENARIISQMIANFAGDFVVATAGGKLEGVLAGKGSGACAYSKEHFCTVANIDIGGGTANFGVFSNGEVKDSGCLAIGGRLIELDTQLKTIKAIADPMKPLLQCMKIGLCVGDQADLVLLNRICEQMAALIWACLFERHENSLKNELVLGEALTYKDPIDVLMFSGGVADFIYEPLSDRQYSAIAQYGDIGPLLGFAVHQYFSQRNVKILKPIETIRATVIGAGAQSLDVSGSTIRVDEQQLPLKNVPVILPYVSGLGGDYSGLIDSIVQLKKPYLDHNVVEPIAIGIMGKHVYRFAEIQRLAETLNLAHGKSESPLIVILQQDAGKVLGQSLQTINPKIHVICIDQISVSEGDYIDIGKPISGGTVVPIVIKTLVF